MNLYSLVVIFAVWYGAFNGFWDFLFMLGIGTGLFFGLAIGFLGCSR